MTVRHVVGLTNDRRVVVLDDDPTGVQTLAGVRVLLRWDAGLVREALAGRRAVHLITNVRALPAEEALEVTGSAARTALAGAPDALVILRGDSTLRGHLREEVLALAEVAAPGRRLPPLLLVPALPSAGRVTIGGVHMLEREGRRVPLHETEYAFDGVFAYTDARVLAWAEERTAGLVRVGDGRELHLEELRAGGPSLVAAVLRQLEHVGRPSALVPDVENELDLELVARGYERALEEGLTVLVRCAPAFAGALSGTTAESVAPAPRAERALVVCGSYLPTATVQLDALVDAYPGSLVEVDVDALVSSDPDPEIARAAGTASSLLRAGPLAVLATPRRRPAGTETFAAGGRISAGLARAAGRVSPRPTCVVVKGGITSCVTLRDGFGATEADVVGPLLPGVSRWRTEDLDYVVVPGNVGDEHLLADVVARVLGG
jgi:uncharacterized protein YgbK (DUF1537 family)